MKLAELKIVCQYAANGETLELILSDCFQIFLHRELHRFAPGVADHVSCS